MFDYTSDEDMLPDGHLDDPRINDLKKPATWYLKNFVYDTSKKLHMFWAIKNTQWVQKRERPF